MHTDDQAIFIEDLASGENRRTVTLDATLRLLAERGVDSVSHRRLAAAAGVPLGSTTYYFDSGEQLQREAFLRYIALVSRTRESLAVPLAMVTMATRPFAESDPESRYGSSEQVGCRPTPIGRHVEVRPNPGRGGYRGGNRTHAMHSGRDHALISAQPLRNALWV